MLEGFVCLAMSLPSNWLLADSGVPAFFCQGSCLAVRVAISNVVKPCLLGASMCESKPSVLNGQSELLADSALSRFEVGDVVIQEPTREVGCKNVRRLVAVHANMRSQFSLLQLACS